MFYQNIGSVRGSCTHKHKNIEEAAKCQVKENVECVNDGYNGIDMSNTYSDRKLFKFTNNGVGCRIGLKEVKMFRKYVYSLQYIGNICG